MESLRGEADVIVDSTSLTPRELRDRVRGVFAAPSQPEGLHVSLRSFGYKYGAPRDADLVLDVRFLPNPHWVERLRPLPGTHPDVREYVSQRQAYPEFMRRLEALLESVLPGYQKEGKAYLSIAVGCTGGRHRSVVCADVLAEWFRARGYPVNVLHRDIDRD